MVGSGSTSAFDILGAISFAQGVLTLIAAVVAAIESSFTTQLDSNRVQCFLYAEKLRSMLGGLASYAEQSDSALALSNVQPAIERARILLIRVDAINQIPAFSRWRRSIAISEELVKIIAEVDLFSQKIIFIRLEARMERMERLLQLLVDKEERLSHMSQAIPRDTLPPLFEHPDSGERTRMLERIHTASGYGSHSTR